MSFFFLLSTFLQHTLPSFLQFLSPSFLHLISFLHSFICCLFSGLPSFPSLSVPSFLRLLSVPCIFRPPSLPLFLHSFTCYLFLNFPSLPVHSFQSFACCLPSLPFSSFIPSLAVRSPPSVLPFLYLTVVVDWWISVTRGPNLLGDSSLWEPLRGWGNGEKALEEGRRRRGMGGRRTRVGEGA